jgi:uncharacterized protein (TIGR02001 family)
MPAQSRDQPVAFPLVPPPRRPKRAALLLALLGAGCAAQAQTSGSIGLVSENSLRGLSLSDGKPALQLRIEHEGAAGWYGGGFASTVSLPGGYAHGQLVAYGGYVRRTPAGLAWELGASRTAFAGEHRFDYLETYAGVALERIGARLYFSPSYYGAGRTAYLELSGNYPLGERLRLIAQAGMLRRLGWEAGARQRIDLRLGIGADLGDYSLHLAWLARQRDPASRARLAQALAAGAIYDF